MSHCYCMIFNSVISKRRTGDGVEEDRMKITAKVDRKRERRRRLAIGYWGGREREVATGADKYDG